MERGAQVDRGDRAALEGLPLSLRIGRWAVILVAAFYLVPTVEAALKEGTAGQAILAVTLGAAVVVLHGLASRLYYTAEPPRLRQRWGLVAVALLSYCPVLIFGEWWFFVPCVLVAMVMGSFRWPLSALLLALVGVAEVAVVLVVDGSLDMAVYATMGVLIPGLVLHVLGRFVGMACELYVTRAQLVAAEVDEHRLRTAQGLRDLLGESLADIEMRGGRILILIEEGRQELQQELRGLLDIAERVQRDMRDFAHREQRMQMGKGD